MRLKNLTKAGLVVLCLLGSTGLDAQSAFPTGYEWVVPRTSQQARVYQKLGVTEIEVIYSRPYVRDRDIWQEPGIAPYGKVWRAGANEATIVSFSTPVKVAGKDLKAGKYAFFVQPEEEGPWVIIFNSVFSQWGAFTHDPSKDVLRVEIMPKEAEHREALEFSFPTLTEDETEMVLHWGERQIVVPISVDIEATSIVRANATFDWQAGFFAAQHFIDIGQFKEALKWVNASIAMQENYSNLNQKITILESLGNKIQVLETAEYVLKLTEGKEDGRSKRFHQMMLDKIKALGG